MAAPVLDIRMKKAIERSLLLLPSVLLDAYIAWDNYYPDHWEQIDGVTVTADGKPVRDPKVYSSHGTLMIELDDLQDWYLIRSGPWLLMGGAQIIHSWFGLRSKPGSGVTVTWGGKAAGDPRVSINKGDLAFIDYKGR